MGEKSEVGDGTVLMADGRREERGGGYSSQRWNCYRVDAGGLEYLLCETNEDEPKLTTQLLRPASHSYTAASASSCFLHRSSSTTNSTDHGRGGYDGIHLVDV